MHFHIKCFGNRPECMERRSLISTFNVGNRASCKATTLREFGSARVSPRAAAVLSSALRVRRVFLSQVFVALNKNIGVQNQNIKQ